MSPIHIGELTTEVRTQSAPGAEATGPGAAERPWDELDRLRRVEAELAELRARTSAEGLDAG